MSWQSIGDVHAKASSALSESSQYILPQTCEICDIRDRKFWCNMCESMFCDDCWADQPLHNLKRQKAADHEKTPLELAEVILSILGQRKDPSEENRLHEENYKTKWFGVLHEENSIYFQDFGRYGRLAIGMGGRDDIPLQYPSLSSFVGETGSGKSTLVGALMKVISLQVPQGAIYPMLIRFRSRIPTPRHR
jgi:hypothetical protein